MAVFDSVTPTDPHPHEMATGASPVWKRLRGPLESCLTPRRDLAGTFKGVRRVFFRFLVNASSSFAYLLLQ